MKRFSDRATRVCCRPYRQSPRRPLVAEAQPAGKVVRIGLLSYAASDSGGDARWKAFREQLRELGYVEGQNVIFEFRWGDEQVNPLRGLAAELVSATP